jgi:predicted HTH domain antitoxin
LEFAGIIFLSSPLRHEDFPLEKRAVREQPPIMNTLLVEYPECLPDSARLSRQEFEHAMRFALASKLFELGRVSSGQAAALVPTDRYSFLRSLHEVGVSAVAWDTDEFSEEISNA